MNFRDFFEPSFGAYATYFLNFSIRYFVIGGAFCWLFRQRWLVYRIQRNFPSTREIGYEIRWSMLNASCTGLSTIMLYGLVRDGKTAMYFSIADYGWPYFFLSAALLVVGYDAWFYWYHRLMHTPWMFEHVHSIHHLSSNPTAFAAYALHPAETFIGNSFFVFFPLVIPVHPIAFGAAGFGISMYAFILHSGYEFFPHGFTRHSLLGWISTSTHHNMHHRDTDGNYGALFTYWDRLMRTNDPHYHEAFETVAGQRLSA